MGKCDLCGQDAGFLSKRHKVCAAKMAAGETEIVSFVAQSALTDSDVPSLQSKIAEIAHRSFLQEQDMRPLIVEGWEAAASGALEGGTPSQEEQDSLFAFVRHLSLSQEELGRAGVYARLANVIAAAGKTEVASLVAQSALNSADIPSLQNKIAEIAQRAFLSEQDLRPLLVAGWERAVSRALEDDVLSQEEENSLTELAKSLSLSQAELDRAGAYTRVIKAAVIRDVLDGEVPQRVSFEGELPFNLQKGETLVWAFPGTTYLEVRTRRSYQGGYQGMSFKVAKGVYYRVGGFKGHPVSTDEAVNLGTGLFAVTDKNMYFAGPGKSFRVKYDKIVSFTPYSDGIGIQRDAQTAKPQTFVTGDGWFTYNLVANLAKVHA
jgi:hypothetical protein